jgi:hypothetical protein
LLPSTPAATAESTKAAPSAKPATPKSITAAESATAAEAITAAKATTTTAALEVLETLARKIATRSVLCLAVGIA